MSQVRLPIPPLRHLVFSTAKPVCKGIKTYLDCIFKFSISARKAGKFYSTDMPASDARKEHTGLSALSQGSIHFFGSLQSECAFLFKCKQDITAAHKDNIICLVLNNVFVCPKIFSSGITVRPNIFSSQTTNLR